MKPLFQMIKEKNQQLRSEPESVWPWDVTVCGVISNSDDRVASILSSMGISTPHLRVEGFFPVQKKKKPVYRDLNFMVLSYDVGAEKPDRRMFSAAEGLCQAFLIHEGVGSLTSPGHRMGQSFVRFEDFTYLHVGDDARQDVGGAKLAGWNSILLDRAGRFSDHFQGQSLVPAPVEVEEGREHGSSSQPELLVAQDLRALCHWRP